MQQAVKAWLDQDGEISAGIDLLEKAGGNPYLVKHFRAIGNRSRKLLRDQLEKILPDLPVEKIRYRQDFGAEPPAIKKLNAKKSEIFKRMSYLHALLSNYTVSDPQGPGHQVQVVFHAFRDGSDLTPAKAASEILQLQGKLSAIWEQLDYYALHGKLPDPEPQQVSGPETAFELMKRWISLRSYLSRSPDSPKRQEWTDEMSQVEQRLQKTNVPAL